jgi:hypothetical protein
VAGLSRGESPTKRGWHAAVVACLLVGACGGEPADEPAVVADTPAAVPQVDTRPPVVSCGPPRVNAILRANVVAPTTDPDQYALGLRAAAVRVLTPLGDRVVVDSVDVSPVIRAFRVTVRAPEDVAGVLDELTRHPQVQAVEPDECALRALGR